MRTIDSSHHRMESTIGAPFLASPAAERYASLFRHRHISELSMRYAVQCMGPGERGFDKPTWCETAIAAEAHALNNNRRFSWRITDRLTGKVTVLLAKHRAWKNMTVEAVMAIPAESPDPVDYMAIKPGEKAI
jgi:hypothetical protein